MSISHARLFYAQGLLFITIISAHALALLLYLYWYFPLLNRLMHFAGGLWVALFLTWVLLSLNRRPIFLLIFSGVIVVGVLWEVFEWVTGLTREPMSTRDTTLDLIMDMIGGFIGAFLAHRIDAHATIAHHGEVESDAPEPHGGAA